MKHTL